jgi:hypothetical protein
MMKSGRSPPTASANIHATRLYIYMLLKTIATKKGVAGGATV